jgi:hypothetical protein
MDSHRREVCAVLVESPLGAVHKTVSLVLCLSDFPPLLIPYGEFLCVPNHPVDLCLR